METKVFNGIKVVDFGWVIAGPLTLKNLADYGATVVHVESPQRPDLLRTSTPYKDGKAGVDRAGYYAYFAGNKYSMSLDLNNTRGLEIAKKLVSWADVVADSHRPGVMESLGLDYEELRKIKPDIIMIRNSNQGTTGPHASHPGLGNHINGLAGFVNLVGLPDEEPISLIVAYTDYLVPHFAVAALIGALDYKRRAGKGQLLDVSQFEMGLQLIAPLLLNYTANGIEATACGNMSDCAVPHGVYKCRGDDKWCTISVFTEDEWVALCETIGKPEWIQEPKFATLEQRREHEEELNKLIQDWISNNEADKVMKTLQEAGVAAGIVQNAEDLYKDPQLKERECFWTAEHRELGNFSHLAQPSRLSKTPARLYRPAPCLGEHTEFVCRELLNIPEAEYESYLIDGAFW
jgi:benzylsuccinate CoA-transferase BbsF subunit